MPPLRLTGFLLLVTMGMAWVFLSCSRPTEPPPYVRSIELEALDASCTESWLKVKLVGVAPPQTVQIRRDEQPVMTLGLSTPDSVVVDEGLLPSRSYSYKAYRLQDSQFIDSSTQATLRTLDTTSHDFTFRIDTLGDGSGSVLYDVAIINDTLAYAVGEIYKRDSVGSWDPNAYNLVKWNGQRWELKRIQFYTFCGQSGTGSYPAKSLYAFGPTDVWIGMSGSQVVRWNGENQSAPVCTPVSINKLWGETPNSVYAVGNGGGIAHYSSGTWRRLESGTNAGINDIWGGRSRYLGEDIVLMAAGNKYTQAQTMLLRVRNGVLDSITAWSYLWPRYSVWFDDRSPVFTSGGGLFVSTRTGWERVLEIPPVFTNRVRGTRPNHVFVVGDFGLVAHFNGVSWRVYPDIPEVILHSVAVKGGNVIGVGYDGNRAIVVHGMQH